MSEPLRDLVDKITGNDAFREWSHTLFAGGVAAGKIVEGLRPGVIAAAALRAKGPLVVLTKTQAGAERLADELCDYLPEFRVTVLPDWGSYPFESVRPDIEAIGRRAEVFEKLAAGEDLVVTMAAVTALQKVPKPRAEVYKGIKVAAGREAPVDKLLVELVELGYLRVPVVECPGEFAARGSVVDIFPSQSLSPVRLDYFGDEIESIRTFNVSDQRTVSPVNQVDIRPGREFRLTDEAVEKVLGMGASPREDQGVHRWLPAIHELGPVFAYLPNGTTWLVDEPTSVRDEVARFYEELEFTLTEAYTREVPFQAGDYYISPDSFWDGLSERGELSALSSGPESVDFGARRLHGTGADIGRLEKELKQNVKAGLNSVLVLKDEGEQHRLKELLSDLGLDLALEGAGRASLSLTRGRAVEGFIWPDAGLAVYGQVDIFPRRRVEPASAFRARRRGLTDFSDLSIGDLLVHEAHGIAVFAGLTKKTVDGKTREYLILEYAAGDRLFVPMEQMDRVSRYAVPEGANASISRLGGRDWDRATKRARRSIKKLAVDLMGLYAERSQSRGHAFSPDSEWQRDLEAAFPYEATPDQAAAIAAVKKDMESERPMDRLVCGDVGYGKTEVALRAAFKAITDGTQVLMLAPTTILAQQHFATFVERFAPYPVKVEVLSRFISAADQKRVVKSIKSGETDLVIGTHRLLQKDVRFNNLGLVVVDEEQRFGVNHKEKLRELRKVVDVLTLSATPIPRTLQMSISGIRELSLIETPPEGRHPVITYIGEFQAATVRGAVRRELARGGQVFYVHNRVETISHAAAGLREMVPEARLIVGHGRMSEGELERVMTKFVSREADILVCTTIIESGLDIPSANTLIVEDADRLGLGQLYQLRGRVGRGRDRGYAYFTYRPGKPLTEQSIDRLKTIGEFSELGSGYRVALRDLEIRGAGNILGAEQHGHMITIGFELFCDMLRREIRELQGKPEIEPIDVKIELPVNAYLPATYVDDDNVRLEVYRAIAEAGSATELEQVRAEAADRFGPLPPPVANLLSVAELRLRLSAAGISYISLAKERLAIKGKTDALELLSQIPGAKYKLSTGEVVLKVAINRPDIVKYINEIISAIMP